MNEKYGIELQLLTSAFNKQVEQVKKQAESIKKAFNDIDVNFSSKAFDKKANEINETAKSIKKAFDPSDVSGMKINGLSQIKGISNEFKKLTGKKRASKHI